MKSSMSSLEAKCVVFIKREFVKNRLQNLTQTHIVLDRKDICNV